MQKCQNRKPTRSRFTLLRQLCNLIPNHVVPALARQHDAESKSRTFKPWSHVVCLIYAQLTHALGLNDVCDALRLNWVRSRQSAGQRRRARMPCRMPTGNATRAWPKPCSGKCSKDCSIWRRSLVAVDARGSRFGSSD